LARGRKGIIHHALYGESGSTAEHLRVLDYKIRQGKYYPSLYMPERSRTCFRPGAPVQRRTSRKYCWQNICRSGIIIL